MGKKASEMTKEELLASLQPRMRTAAEIYIENGGNKKQAALDAGYSESYANGNANKLFSTARMKAYIAMRRREIERRTGITKDKVLLAMADIAFSDLGDYVQVAVDEDESGYQWKHLNLTETKDLTKEQRAALAQIKRTKNGGIEIKMHDKLRALDMIARHLGMYEGSTDTDNVKVEIIDDL